MPRGSRIVIVLGMRPFVHEGAAERLAIDQHDHMAFAYLNAYFSKLRSNCRIESVAFPRQMTVPEAMHELQELESCKDVGALIVVGSSVSNPATVPMARMILPVGVTAPPAQLHWMFPLTNPPQREDPLSDDTYGELRGMSVGSGNDAEFFARDDRHDAGMVLLRRKSGKRNVVTALLAGHGGHGTYASARAVTQPFDIAERLVRSGGWDVEPDYAFAPIAVETGRAPQGQGARWRFITPDPDAEERWFDFKLRSVNCSAHAAAMPEPAPVG
jgi:hypothetical protein